jgi:hypothetical protein
MKEVLLLTVGLIATYLGACTIQVPPTNGSYTGPTNESPSNPTPSQATPPVVYRPTAPAPAPAPALAPVIKYGPGTGNNIQTPVEGYLTIRTNSANGRLTLRSNPSQDGASIVEIPNGTSGIYYNSRVQTGDHVWYYAFYNGSEGWLRGDYLTIEPIMYE